MANPCGGNLDEESAVGADVARQERLAAVFRV